MFDKLVIGVSGKKQSGKNTMCDCLYKIFTEKYGSEHVAILSFADALKQKVCKDALGLTEEQVNGTDEQKNSPTMYNWKNIPHEVRYHNRLGERRTPRGEVYQFILPEGFMTAREIMQIVGTDIFRNYFDDSIWVNATLREIAKSKAQVILISDVRFPSEVTSIVDEGAYVVRLLRDVCETDSHASETALDDFDFTIDRCIIFDNKEMTIEQQNNATLSIVEEMESIKCK
jgi:hypothetical protein